MKTEHMYELLFEAVKTGSIDAIRKASSEIFDAPVFITDTSFRVLSADPDPGSKDDMLEKNDSFLYVSSSLVNEFNEHKLLDAYVSKVHDVILVNWGWFKKHPHITTGIFYEQKILGSVTVLVQNEEISDEMKDALLQCADACAIVLHNNKEGRRRLQTRDHLASQIFRGSASADSIEVAFRQGIIKKDDHYKVIASELTPDSSWEIILQNQCACLLYHKESITFILTPDSSDISGYIKWTNSRGGLIGISFSFNDLALCPRMAQQAQLSIQYGHNILHKNEVDFTKEDLFILMHQEENQVYIHPVLQEIREYDIENNTDYIHTISIWLKSRMDDSIASDSLHIHRNTLYYRLKRISELFHLNLHDMNTCVQLYLSICSKA